MNKKNATKEKQLNTLRTHAMYERDQLLLIDISPADSTQFWTHKVLHQTGHTTKEYCPIKKRITKFKKYWIPQILEMQGIKYIKIAIEASHEGRLHLHTMVCLSDPLEFCSWIGYFKHVNFRKFTYKIDTIQDKEFRLLYMKKDVKTMKEKAICSYIERTFGEGDSEEEEPSSPSQEGEESSSGLLLVKEIKVKSHEEYKNK